MMTLIRLLLIYSGSEAHCNKNFRSNGHKFSFWVRCVIADWTAMADWDNNIWEDR